MSVSRVTERNESAFVVSSSSSIFFYFFSQRRRRSEEEKKEDFLNSSLFFSQKVVFLFVASHLQKNLQSAPPKTLERERDCFLGGHELSSKSSSRASCQSRRPLLPEHIKGQK